MTREVRIRFRDGHVEDVTAARAARLLDAKEAEPEGEWTEADAEAVMVAHEKRQAAMAETLQRDGLMPGSSPPVPMDLGPMGRLAFLRGGF